ncbi:MAG: flagellar type III secretion system pore protein FliP [Fibrobacterota bacterium]
MKPKVLFPVRTRFLIRVMLCVFVLIAGAAAAPNIPSLTVSMTDTDNPQEVARVMQVVFLITILSIAPSILIMMTSFVRLIIVFSFIRRALGINTMPPNQILITLALFLTFFIMSPVFTEINDQALQPYLNEEISWEQGLETAGAPLREFMLNQVHESDVALFLKVSDAPTPQTPQDISFTVLIPAFMISELKTAFTIGFMIFIPFVVLDMIVASVLLSMGMMMLPPVMISLPFKIVLFVLVDGWNLIIKELVLSFN